jgi:hypothetical protein
MSLGKSSEGIVKQKIPFVEAIGKPERTKITFVENDKATLALQ